MHKRIQYLLILVLFALATSTVGGIQPHLQGSVIPFHKNSSNQIINSSKQYVNAAFCHNDSSEKLVPDITGAKPILANILKSLSVLPAKYLVYNATNFVAFRIPKYRFNILIHHLRYMCLFSFHFFW